MLTSNVDGRFAENGFDTQRLYTPQGDFEVPNTRNELTCFRMTHFQKKKKISQKWIQCYNKCTQQVWPSKTYYEKIIKNTNPETQEVTDPSVIPTCPNCKGPMMMNVRGGDFFLETPYEEQHKRFTKWINDKAANKKKLLMIEIGAGFNTPSVIRWR